MEKFNTLTGVAAPLPQINVDTDMIIPKQFLKTIKRTGLGKNLFHEMRYDAEMGEIEDFVLNQPAYRDASILVAVSTPHRRDAFEAAQWLMDTIKQDVPIWKQEHWADGSQEWVHPGASTTSVGPSEAPTRAPRSARASHG